jgi:hypothetical protein
MEQTILDERTVKILDELVNKTLEFEIKNGVSGKELPIITNYIMKLYPEELLETSIQYDDYKYYLDILDEYKVVKIDMYGNDFHIKPIPFRTFNFKNNGGFENIYKEQQRVINRNEKLDEIIYNKSQFDLKISKFQVKTKWWPLIISLLSIAISIFALCKIFNQTKNNNDNINNKVNKAILKFDTIPKRMIHKINK